MRRFPNIKQLLDANGDPCFLQDPERDSSGGFVPLKDDDGRILRDENGNPLAKVKKITPSLGQWIIYTLNGIPPARGTMRDAERFSAVIRSCTKNEGTISLDNDDFEWLHRILFDDAQGQVFDKDALGALAVQRWGYWRAAALKDAMETKADADVETIPGPVPMNRAERRAAK